MSAERNNRGKVNPNPWGEVKVAFDATVKGNHLVCLLLFSMEPLYSPIFSEQ